MTIIGYHNLFPSWSWCERTTRFLLIPKMSIKTAVTTPFGLFEFLKMLFRLRYAAQTSLTKYFVEFLWPTPASMIFSLPAATQSNISRTYELSLSVSPHMVVVVNPNKCLFDVAELDFLRHWINQDGITPLPQKVHNFPQPESPRQLHRFIGLENFYYRCLLCCTEIMLPLHALLSSSKPKSQSLSWNDFSLASFHVTKNALAEASLLFYSQWCSYLHGDRCLG